MHVDLVRDGFRFVKLRMFDGLALVAEATIGEDNLERLHDACAHFLNTIDEDSNELDEIFWEDDYIPEFVDDDNPDDDLRDALDGPVPEVRLVCRWEEISTNCEDDDSV